MTLEQAQSASITLDNARQIVINEGSYISRRVGDWTASLSTGLSDGFKVEFRYKGEFLANEVFGQLESAVNYLNERVRNVVNDHKEDELRRSK